MEISLLQIRIFLLIVASGLLLSCADSGFHVEPKGDNISTDKAKHSNSEIEENVTEEDLDYEILKKKLGKSKKTGELNPQDELNPVLLPSPSKENVESNKITSVDIDLLTAQKSLGRYSFATISNIKQKLNIEPSLSVEEMAILNTEETDLNEQDIAQNKNPSSSVNWAELEANSALEDEASELGNYEARLKLFIKNNLNAKNKAVAPTPLYMPANSQQNFAPAGDATSAKVKKQINNEIKEPAAQKQEVLVPEQYQTESVGAELRSQDFIEMSDTKSNIVLPELGDDNFADIRVRISPLSYVYKGDDYSISADTSKMGFYNSGGLEISFLKVIDKAQSKFTQLGASIKNIRAIQYYYSSKTKEGFVFLSGHNANMTQKSLTIKVPNATETIFIKPMKQSEHTRYCYGEAVNMNYPTQSDNLCLAIPVINPKHLANKKLQKWMWRDSSRLFRGSFLLQNTEIPVFVKINSTTKQRNYLNNNSPNMYAKLPASSALFSAIKSQHRGLRLRLVSLEKADMGKVILDLGDFRTISLKSNSQTGNLELNLAESLASQLQVEGGVENTPEIENLNGHELVSNKKNAKQKPQDGLAKIMESYKKNLDMDIPNSKVGFWIQPLNELDKTMSYSARFTSSIIKTKTANFKGSVLVVPEDMAEVDFPIRPMSMINLVNMNQYLYSVVAKEMGGWFSPEALKAQTVAARTYAYNRMLSARNETNKRNWDVAPTQADQAYLGVSAEKNHENIQEIVDATESYIVANKSNRSIFEAMYHAYSGGHTCSYSVCYGGPSQESPMYRALVGVPEAKGFEQMRFSRAANDDRLVSNVYRKSFKMNLRKTSKQQTQHLAGFISRLSKLKSVIIVNKNEQRQQKIKFVGLDKNNKEFESDVISVEDLGYSNADIYSYSVVDSDNLRITKMNFGHSVGMSQFGAEHLARLNRDFKFILKYYYQNIDVVNLNK